MYIVCNNIEEFFRDRLRLFRNEKDISAREMSLELGQNETYINKIETGKCSLSMSSFFNICEYLNISPSKFFNDQVNNTQGTEEELYTYFRKLTPKQAKYILQLLKDLTSK